MLIAAALSMAACFGPMQPSTAQSINQPSAANIMQVPKMSAPNTPPALPDSAEYRDVQRRLARGWNTWDVHSVMSHVLLPDGLAIRVGLQHNSTEGGDSFLSDALIGRQTPGAEQVVPGPHAWDGSYTDLTLEWMGHELRIQSAHDGSDMVLLATPLPSKPSSHLLPTLVVSVAYLWNQRGTVERFENGIRARGPRREIRIYCTCRESSKQRSGQALELPLTPDGMVPVTGPYFATDFGAPVGIGTGHSRTLAEIEAIVERERLSYEHTVAASGKNAPVMDAIETTLGWDTIYEPERGRVVSPVSRVWCVGWGGYVIFDWDTFLAASMASIGDRDLAYADAVETLKTLLDDAPATDKAA